MEMFSLFLNEVEVLFRFELLSYLFLGGYFTLTEIYHEKEKIVDGKDIQLIPESSCFVKYKHFEFSSRMNGEIRHWRMFGFPE